jgi:hypothetical protein
VIDLAAMVRLRADLADRQPQFFTLALNSQAQKTVTAMVT